jgi:hypothetical protein
VFKSGLTHSAFPTKSSYAFLISSMHDTCPTNLTLLDFIIPVISGSLHVTNYEARHYAIFSIFLSLLTGSIQTLSLAPCSQTPPNCVLPLKRETKFHTHTKQQAQLHFNIYVFRRQTGHQRFRDAWTPEFSLL